MNIPKFWQWPGKARTIWRRWREVDRRLAALDEREALVAERERRFKLEEENAALRRQVAELQATSARQAAIEYRNDAVWTGPEADPSSGPFCQNCYGKDGKLIRLRAAANRAYGVCGTCKNSFLVFPELDTTQPRGQQPPRRGGWMRRTRGDDW